MVLAKKINNLFAIFGSNVFVFKQLLVFIQLSRHKALMENLTAWTKPLDIANNGSGFPHQLMILISTSIFWLTRS